MIIKVSVLIAYFVIVLVIGFYSKLVSSHTFLPVIWVMAVTFAVYIITHAVMLWREKSLQIYLPRWISNRYVWIFLGVFILAMDFWAWGKIGPLAWGIPLWVGFFVILSALQTIAMVYLVRKDP